MQGNNNPVFSIAMRIYPDQIRAMDISHMSEYPASTTFDHSLYMENDGRVTARIFDGTNRTVTSTTALTAGTWTHIVLVGNGTNLRLYINGQLEGTTSAGTARVDYATPEFVVGQSQETASCFSGQMANIKLYDYELSDNDITNLAGLLLLCFLLLLPALDREVQ
jgi:hypothetical protein